MIPAKAFGGKVTQYFIGFGPTVWSRQQRRDRVRRQGDPARRLRQDRRDAPARRRARRRGRVRRRRQPRRRCASPTPACSPSSSPTPARPSGRRSRPPTTTGSSTRWPGGRRSIVMAGGPTVNILIAFVIFLGLFVDGRQPADSTIHRPSTRCRACVVPAAEDQPTVLHGRPTRSARRPRRPACSPATGSSRSTAPAIRDWDQLQTLIRGNDDGKADDRRRARRPALTLHTNTTGRRPGHRPRTTRRSSPRSASSASRRRPGTNGQGAGLHRRADGRVTRQTVKALGHAAGEGLGRRRGDRRRQGSATPTARSASSAAAGSPARRPRRTGLPAQGQARSSCSCSSPASTSSSACSTSSRCCRSTAATSPARSGRPYAAASPACAGVPTRLRRRRQAAADRLRRGQLPAGHGRRADRRRPRGAGARST